MKKKKGIGALALLCASLLLVMFAACGAGSGKADSPEKAVSGYIDELKKGNVEKAQSYLVAPDAVANMDALAQADNSRIKESIGSMGYELASSAMFESAMEMAAEEGKEAESAADAVAYDGALVVVNITNKDMTAVADKMTSVMTAESGNFTSMSEKDMKKFWDKTVKDALSQTTETMTNTVNFVLVNENGDWKIKEADGFFAAAFGMGAVLDF